MNLNEVKKILYKEKPIANGTRSIAYTDSGEQGQEYVTETSLGKITFVIPFSEKPEGGFKSTEAAQFLIRYIKKK